MIEKINILELASELSRVKLEKFQSDAKNGFIEELALPNGIYKTARNDKNVLNFTEEAQTKFNQYYDEFLDQIKSCCISTNDNNLKELKLFSYSDLTQRFNNLKHRIEFSNLFKNRFLENFYNVMLTSSIEIEIAKSRVSVEQVNSMSYGEEIDLTKNYASSKYCEEDIISIYYKEDWTELLQVLIDGNQIIFEEL